MTGNEVIAYSYRVVPNNPGWGPTSGEAFEPHDSVTFEHPDERFAEIPGVEAVDVTELVANNCDSITNE